ncbi:rRNA methyltransferase 1, mitochondrial-like [Daphnia carinata]|uniref:rRNA methyltransferase 1, mitochondrial-like n=1 Tax=Daphnia carinata TaxID=120202 RepID=UPI00257DA419|nr:rRNA methyltransferase 1, mitochondrial-like [Daphnia carinata]XP_059351136.1 rRNA methyltransferase 1, mitochondrial-like [Daphnia carinata]
MWSSKVSHFVMQRTFSTSSILKAGLDLMTLDGKKSPGRQELCFDILFGIHPISCAIEAKRRSIETVFYRRDLLNHNVRAKEILERCWAENVKTQVLPQSKIDNIAPKGKPNQGLLAKATRLYYIPTPCTQKFIANSQSEKESCQSPVWLLLNEIQDPMNFGSVLRSAYFMGCNKVFVSSHKSCSLTPVVSKASSGVMELMPVYSVNNPSQFCQILKESKWDIVGTGSHNDETNEKSLVCSPVGSFFRKNPTLIILGNEGQGLPEELVSLCTHRLYIEARPNLNKNIDSMNVSAAAAVILHTILNRSDRS